MLSLVNKLALVNTHLSSQIGIASYSFWCGTAFFLLQTLEIRRFWSIRRIFSFIGLSKTAGMRYYVYWKLPHFYSKLTKFRFLYSRTQGRYRLQLRKYLRSFMTRKCRIQTFQVFYTTCGQFFCNVFRTLITLKVFKKP